MNELFLNRARTVAVTGHRVLQSDFNINKLKEKLLEFIEKGFDTFLVGMALGFDTACFKVLQEIRKEKEIKIIACIPCLSQPYKFNKKQKEEYDLMLSSADEKVLISEEYTKNCMQKRNEYMVDRASVVFAYIKRDFGGTANTIKHAKKKEIPIVKYD